MTRTLVHWRFLFPHVSEAISLLVTTGRYWHNVSREGSVDMFPDIGMCYDCVYDTRSSILCIPGADGHLLIQ